MLRAVLVLCVLLGGGAWGALARERPRRFAGMVALEITPFTDAQLKAAWELDADFWWQEPTRVNLSAIAFVDASKHTKVSSELESRGLGVELLQGDVQQLFDEQYARIDAAKERFQRRRQADDWDADYHDYDDTVVWLRDLVARHASICRMLEVGRSTEGRPIYAVEIFGSSGPNPAKPGIFLNAAIHAREWITPGTVDYILREMLEGYGVDDTITTLIDQLEWTIIPIYNVDGYQYTFDSDPSWRKTRSVNAGSSCLGTDPNRNTPYQWGGVGAATDPCSNTYRGAGPLSEPEVRDVIAYLSSKPNTQAYVDVHAAFHAVLEPWAHITSPPPDIDEIRPVSIAVSRAIEEVNGSFFQYGDWCSLMYASSGVMADFAYATLGITYSWTWELRPSFQPPPSFIVDSGAEIFEAFKTLGFVVISQNQ